MSAGQIPTRQVTGLDAALAAKVDAEGVRDTMAAALVAGSGISIVPDDPGDTITISATGAGSDVVAVRAYATASQLAAYGVWTSAAFTNESFDTDGFHDNATNNTRFTVPAGKGGKYLIAGTVSFASDGTGSGVRYARILKNGVDAYSAVIMPAANAQMRVPVSALLDLAAGDYIELQGRQVSAVGVSLEIGDTTGGGTAGETWLSMFKIGSASGAMAKLGETILGAAAATITFASIPGTYTSLRLVVTARSNAAAATDSARIYANGDTTAANYKNKQFYGSTTTAYTSGSDSHAGYLPGNTHTAGESGVLDILIPHYAKTTFRKNFQSQFYTPSTPASGVTNAVRLNTAAITDLTLALATGQFMAGTVVTLYGMS